MSLDALQHYSILGSQLINLHGLGYLFLKLTTDMIFTFIIIRLIFYPIYKERDYVFATVLINITVFMICFFMGSIKLKIGFAFGLFAVFSIIRYRTEAVPARAMTYMFVVIVIAVINALPDESISFAEVILANTSILAAIWIIENNFLHEREYTKMIKYEKIELIKPENYEKLIEDLRARTGFDIKRAEVETIDFLNDTVLMKIVYLQHEQPKPKKGEKA
jgi:hypothetical protein